MARLLNGRGFTRLLNEFKSRYVKYDEILLPSTSIIHAYPSYNRISLNDVKVNQYYVIEDTINYLNIDNIGKGTEGRKGGKVYFQFKSNTTQFQIKFADMILWKDGKTIEFKENHLYRVEIVECMGMWMGTWYSWQN